MLVNWDFFIVFIIAYKKVAVNKRNAIFVAIYLLFFQKKVLTKQKFVV